MAKANVYVRGEWVTPSGSDGEMGSLSAPVQIDYATGIVFENPWSLATATGVKIYDKDTVPPLGLSDWDCAFIETTQDITVLIRGTTDNDTSCIVVKGGTKSPLISNKTVNYNSALATRLALAATTVITQVWIRNDSGQTAVGRFVAMT